VRGAAVVSLHPRVICGIIRESRASWGFCVARKDPLTTGSPRALDKCDGNRVVSGSLRY